MCVCVLCAEYANDCSTTEKNKHKGDPTKHTQQRGGDGKEKMQAGNLLLSLPSSLGRRRRSLRV